MISLITNLYHIATCLVLTLTIVLRRGRLKKTYCKYMIKFTRNVVYEDVFPLMEREYCKDRSSNNG